jgi:uncharacterized membrane protein
MHHEESMKKYFITGLLILLPLALTVAIVTFIVNFLTSPFLGAVENILEYYNIPKIGILIFSGDQVYRYASQLFILGAIFMAMVLLGLLARWFFFHYLINLGNYILQHIPVVNKLYKTSQDIINTIFASQSQSFKQVVMVPFPQKGIYSIGLITREAPDFCKEEIGADLVSVFVPTSPNPTSGYLLMFKREDIHYIDDMKVEDAAKFIISCGVIHPEDTTEAPPTGSLTSKIRKSLFGKSDDSGEKE